MGLIPQDIIAQVIDRSDIVETIGSYFPLKRAGRNFKANCPFHDEKTPSFVVNPDKQIFHCFGCGVGGNVVSFVMQQERLEFPEAVRQLAQKAGIMIPETKSSNSSEGNVRQLIAQVNALAAEFFHENLTAVKDSASRRAVAYLKGRDIQLETVKQLKLGFALEQWEALLQFLRKKELSLDLIEKAGLILPRKNSNGFYDRFRNRIIFPIFDIKSQCVAFGARAMAQEETAKYINSPETALYTKGNHLYGLHVARDAIVREDCAVVVEGYMDFITPFQSGVRHLVASLGTALTVEQVRLLRRFTRNVVMLYDTDKAGESATLRSLDLLVEEGMDVKVATLAQGEDPDSYIRRSGVERFRERIGEAKTLFDYKFERLKERHDIKSIEGRAKIAGEMLVTIEKFENQIVKSGYLKKLGTLLAIPEDVLLKELDKLRKPQDRPAASLTMALASPQRERIVEKKMLKLLLSDNEFIPMTRDEVDLTDFYDEKVRTVIEKVFELFAQGQEINAATLMGCFHEKEITQMLSGLSASDDEVFEDKTRIHRDFIERIKQDRMKLKRQDLHRQIRLAEEAGDMTRLNELTEQFNRLVKG